MRHRVTSQISNKDSKEHTASIFEVQESFILNMEEAGSPEMLVLIHRTTRRYIPEGFGLDTVMRI
jgi:hypothetical protein